MKKKKLIKLSNNIVLSIKYSVLKDIISGTKDTDLALEEKKMAFPLTDKKLEKNQAFISDVKNEIRKIEMINANNSYTLIERNLLEKELEKSKNNEINSIKYDVVIRSLLDNINITMASDKFIEELSLQLFENKKEIKNIINNYKKISSEIRGTQLLDSFDKSVKTLLNIPFQNYAKPIMVMPKKPLLIGGVIIGAGLIAFNYVNARKNAKKMSTLGPGELANDLIITATQLYYAERLFGKDDEYTYKLYFKSKLSEINLKRKYILKEIFEDFKEFDSNSLKVKLLHNFDNYLINNIKTQNKKKKRGK